MIKTIQLPIHEATAAQIRSYAETLQLDLSGTRTDADVLSLLATAWPFSWIPVAEINEDAISPQTAVALPAVQQDPVQGGIGANDPKVRLRIGETELPGGKEPVALGVNGRTIVVQRKLVVDMPYRYFLAMKNAVRENIEQDPFTRELISSEITNYPLLEIIAMPSAEEVAAWHARTDNELMPA